jgi:hypothetical protein
MDEEGYFDVPLSKLLQFIRNAGLFEANQKRIHYATDGMWRQRKSRFGATRIY